MSCQQVKNRKRNDKHRKTESDEAHREAQTDAEIEIVETEIAEIEIAETETFFSRFAYP